MRSIGPPKARPMPSLPGPPRRDGRRGIQPHRELAFAQQLRSTRRGRRNPRHVLHAGDAVRCGLAQGAFDGAAPLRGARRRDDLGQDRGSILERAGGLPAASRTMTPPGGFGVAAVMPASANALELTRIMWPS
jgi:hypothetical protein